MVGVRLAGRKWLRRGLNIVAVTTGLVGGLYLLVQFTLAKFNEMQERLLRDRVAREKYVASLTQLASPLLAEPGGLQLYDYGAAPDALGADL